MVPLGIRSKLGKLRLLGFRGIEHNSFAIVYTEGNNKDNYKLLLFKDDKEQEINLNNTNIRQLERTTIVHKNTIRLLDNFVIIMQEVEDQFSWTNPSGATSIYAIGSELNLAQLCFDEIEKFYRNNKELQYTQIEWENITVDSIVLYGAYDVMGHLHLGNNIRYKDTDALLIEYYINNISTAAAFILKTGEMFMLQQLGEFDNVKGRLILDTAQFKLVYKSDSFVRNSGDPVRNVSIAYIKVKGYYKIGYSIAGEDDVAIPIYYISIDEGKVHLLTPRQILSGFNSWRLRHPEHLGYSEPLEQIRRPEREDYELIQLTDND